MELLISTKETNAKCLKHGVYEYSTIVCDKMWVNVFSSFPLANNITCIIRGVHAFDNKRGPLVISQQFPGGLSSWLGGAGRAMANPSVVMANPSIVGAHNNLYRKKYPCGSAYHMYKGVEGIVYGICVVRIY